MTAVHDLWISMAGPAGVGKSTLAEKLGQSLRGQGSPTDTFGEEELFTRSEFTRVADGFRSKDYAGPEEFEAAYGAWLDSLPPGSIGVMDWNPAGMTGDLPWAMTDAARYRAHLARVRAVAADRVLLLHLQAPAELAVERASQQRGEEWLTRYDEIARADGNDHSERLDRIVADAEHHIVRTNAVVAVAVAAGWPVRTIDATGTPEAVHDAAMTAITL